WQRRLCSPLKRVMLGQRSSWAATCGCGPVSSPSATRFSIGRTVRLGESPSVDSWPRRRGGGGTVTVRGKQWQGELNAAPDRPREVRFRAASRFLPREPAGERGRSPAWFRMIDVQIRLALATFLGDERYQKFIRLLNTTCKHRGRLLF